MSMSKRQHKGEQERMSKSASQIRLVPASARKPINEKANKNISCLEEKEEKHSRIIGKCFAIRKNLH